MRAFYPNSSFFFFFYLQWRKAWIQVDFVFLGVIFLLKFYITRKAIHISTWLWFYSKIAGVLGAESMSVGSLVVEYLQMFKRDKIVSVYNSFQLVVRTVLLTLKDE